MDKPESKRGLNYILAIGIDRYEQDDIEGNTHSVSGTKDLVQFLLQNYQFEPSQVYEIYNENATEEGIDEAFMSLKNIIREQDSLMIIFSGQSVFRAKNREAYWLPYDAQKNSVSASISNTHLVNVYLNQIKAEHLFLLADSVISETVKPQLEIGFQSTELNSCHILASGRSIDDTSMKPISFATHITKFLDEEVLHPLSIQEFVEKAVVYARREWPDLQMMKVQLNDGDWQIEPKSDEDIYWKKVTEEDTEASFTEYLNKYPDGRYKGEAYQKLGYKISRRQFIKAQREDTIKAYEKFILLNASVEEFVKKAEQRIEAIRSEAKTRGSKASYIKSKPSSQRKSIIVKPKKLSPPESSRKRIIISPRNERSETEMPNKSTNQGTNPSEPDSIKDKLGKLLCKLPPQMGINSSHICEIRIAPIQLDESFFTEDITSDSLQDGELNRDTIKISKVMLVEIKELGDNGNFRIESLTDMEQIIEDNDYTFWKYNIVPLRAGQYKLIVKVTAKKHTDKYGERSKDLLVWDRLINVVAGFKPTDHHYELVKSDVDGLMLDKFELKQALGDNQLEGVVNKLEAFFQHVDINLHNQAIKLRRLLKETQKSYENFVLDDREYQRMTQSVAKRLIDLIDQIDFRQNTVEVKGLNQTGNSIAFADLINTLSASE